MRVEGFPTLGIVPLQDQRADVEPHKRAAMLAGRVVARDQRTSAYALGGKRGADDQPNSVGDVGLGSTLWPVEDGARPIPAWFLAAPSVTTKPLVDPEGTVTGPITAALRPAGTDRFGEDTRFAELQAAAIGGARLPKGWPVLVVGATQEQAQVPLAFPANGPLVAVNAAGDPGAASLVADLDSESKVDPQRMARLHTMMRVARPQGGVGLGTSPALAWQLTAAGRDGRPGNGLVYGRAGGAQPPPAPPAQAPTAAPRTQTGGTIARNPTPGGTQAGRPGSSGGTRTGEQQGGVTTARASAGVLALAGRPFGPLDVGGAADVHRCGVTQDGEPVNELHVSTAALFRDPGGGRDGPIDFQQATHVEPPAMPMLTRAHLRYDPTVPHQWAGGTAAGKWRLSAETTASILPPEIEDRVEDPKPDPKDLDPKPEPPPAGGRPLTGSPGGAADPTIGTVGGGGIPVPNPPAPNPWDPGGSANPLTTPSEPPPRPVTGGYPVEPLCKVQAGNLWIGAIASKLSALASPTSAAAFAEAVAVRGPAAVMAELAQRPSVGQLVGFGEGSATGNYVSAPGANNQNAGGPPTATGGVLVLPGDVDPAALLAGEDVETQHDPTQLGFTDALAELGFGTPDATTGRMTDGATIGSEAGTLSVTMTDADGAPDGQTDFKPGGEISMDAALEIAEIATPATPATGHVKIYPKSDGNFYQLDDAGTETQIGGGGGSFNAGLASAELPTIDGGSGAVNTSIKLGHLGGTTVANNVSSLASWSWGAPVYDLSYSNPTPGDIRHTIVITLPGSFSGWGPGGITVRSSLSWPAGGPDPTTFTRAISIANGSALASATSNTAYPSTFTNSDQSISQATLNALGLVAGDSFLLSFTGTNQSTSGFSAPYTARWAVESITIDMQVTPA